MAESVAAYRTVTPYFVVRDANAELAFLEAAFDATESSVHRDGDNAVVHAELRIGDSLVMLGQANAQWTPITGAIYLWIADVDASYAKALRAGATSQSEPEDKPYGHRNAGVVDPNGVTWWLAAPVK